jgi:hypothetical protein
VLSAPLFRRLQHLPPILPPTPTINWQHSSIRPQRCCSTLFHSQQRTLLQHGTWERSGTQPRLRPSHCRAYVTATNNPIKGNQQKGSVFWDSVKDEFAKECPDGQREVAPIKRFISGELLPDVNQFLSRLRDVYTKQLTVTLPTRSRST